jgi:RimJ/RimL family protein N-acetyltransferase
LGTARRLGQDWPVTAEIGGHGVRLRPYRPEDAGPVAAGYDDELCRRYMAPLPSPFTAAHAERFLTDGVAQVHGEGGAVYAIADPGTDQVLGGIGYDKVNPARGQAEIGYWVGPWARGKGVATAAVRALSGYVLQTGLHRLELLTHWDNAISQRVALAAGYRREGVRRGAIPRGDGHDDLLAFARLAGEPDGPTERLLPDLPGGELSDGVVTLRPLGPADAAFLSRLRSLPEVVSTSVPPRPPTARDIHERVTRSQAHWLAGTRADMVIMDAATGAAAGDIGLFYGEPLTGQAMIGYSMLPGFRGRGFTTRAAQLVALWAFAETTVGRLIAGALPGNVASQRVLEKAGFRREGYLRGRLPGPRGTREDDVQFALLAEDLLTEGPRLGHGNG